MGRAQQIRLARAWCATALVNSTDSAICTQHNRAAGQRINIMRMPDQDSGNIRN
jgi:hypothetical protein